jgi:PAS domain S-box-containing protein
MGQLIYDLGNRQWDIPKLRELLETILPQKTSFDNFEVEHEFTTIGKRVMLLNAREIQQALGRERIILLAIEDITEHKRLEILLMESEELYKGVYKTASDGIVLLEKREGRISQVNPAAEKMLGYSAKECIGNKLQDIGFMLDLGDFQTTMQNLNKHGIINYEDVPVKTKSGQHINTDIYLVDKTKVVQCNIRDITERKQAEGKIRNSLAEKEVLLKEVHHRVKNNLMVIIGLIKMEETKADNEMFNHLLQELEGRIRSMAQVHEGFYKSADLAHVNLQNYIETMGAQISAQFGTDRNIRFSVQAVGVELGLDVAVPCGLILNELITNAYKHAFPGNRPCSEQGNCEINVYVNQEGNMNVLTVTSNGVGLPADLDLEKSETLGLRLVKMLIKQINGSIELDRSTGTAFRLKFPVADKIH